MRQYRPLADIEERYPGCWAKLNEMHIARGAGLPDWPKWCYVPSAGPVSIVCPDPEKQRKPCERALLDVAQLTGLSAWSRAKELYRFNPIFWSRLARAEITPSVAVESLFNIPNWCVYVEVQGIKNCFGYYAFLDYHLEKESPFFYFLFDRKDGKLSFLRFEMRKMGSLRALIDDIDSSNKNTLRELSGHVNSNSCPLEEYVFSPYHTLTVCFSSYLYLCKQGSDIVDLSGKKSFHEKKKFTPSPFSAWGAGYSFSLECNSKELSKLPRWEYSSESKLTLNLNTAKLPF